MTYQVGVGLVPGAMNFWARAALRASFSLVILRNQSWILRGATVQVYILSRPPVLGFIFGSVQITLPSLFFSM